MNKRKSKKTTDSKKSDKSKGLNIELQETKDKYLRLYSEFENYRRRTSKEKIEMIDSANKELLSDILPVVDDFERASKAIKKEDESYLEGFNLIHQKLISTLEKYNVKEKLERVKNYNVSVEEINDEIIFLRKLIPIRI